jgi:hypothetical protein
MCAQSIVRVTSAVISGDAHVAVYGAIRRFVPQPARTVAKRVLRERGSLSATEQSLTWIVGSPRSGTTWLAGLLSRFPDIGYVNEPLIGLHLGVVFDQVIAAPPKAGPAVGGRIYDLINLVGEDDYFFSDNHRHVWQPALRKLLLTRFREQMYQRGLQPGRGRLLLKEPHGSEGADILGSTLAQSRLLLLVRDGRDVLDSELDSIAPGSWSSYAVSTEALDDDERSRLIEAQAGRWVLRSRVAQQAFGRHDESRRLLIRYEELLADTEAHVRRIVEWLGLPTPANVAEVVTATTFANLPAERTGPGQFARAASPGLWRERFNDTEQAMLARVMGEQLAILGYDV